MNEKKALTDGNQVQYGLSTHSKSFRLSYSKTNKLITALYMVTDIMDTNDPIRSRLRLLGTEILSDIHIIPTIPRVWESKILTKISEALSFLDIAFAVGMISEMNSSILKKEFLELNNSMEEAIKKVSPVESQTSIASLFKNEPGLPDRTGASKGHATPTRIGVQKGGTLLKALSDRTLNMSDTKESFDLTKRQRREEIVAIVRSYAQTYPALGGATITDIKMKAEGPIATCGEKTLQRELAAMVSEGVLNKTGSKRWSRYSFARHT